MAGSHLSDWIALAGLISGFVGSMMMARVYISTVRIRDLPSALIRIWFRENPAIRDATEINAPNNSLVVRGLSLLVLGFLLQAVALVISITSYTGAR